ncbi:hypothetical protein [Roseomonas rosulenta]|uniref:hypothetical protein n=1 Tax=Roseomonas rosulenta TaxID=2748667 RepID=UPI0018E03834|nr:hypothetical protein [Roseomonas rosulenta]
MRGPVGFFAVLLFWPALFLTLLPLPLYAVGAVLRLIGAPSSQAAQWELGAGYALILTMLAAPAAVVLGVIALATKPAPRRQGPPSRDAA